MVRIRLRRVGAKKQPQYRVVVADQRSPRDGRHIETIGHYNPRTEPETVTIKEDRALYWLSKGAQPSDAVLRMLEKQGTMDRLARLKKGESLEALIAEYETEVVTQESAEPVEVAAVEPAVVAPEAEALEAEAEVEAAVVGEEAADAAEVDTAAETDAEAAEVDTAAETDAEASEDEG